MAKDEIKSKLRDLAECGGDDALLPQTLLELIEAGEVSAANISKVQGAIVASEQKSTQQIAAIIEAGEVSAANISKVQGEIVASEQKSTQQIAAITESLRSIQKTQQTSFASLETKSSWSIYLVSAILVVVLAAGGFCAWVFL